MHCRHYIFRGDVPRSIAGQVFVLQLAEHIMILIINEVEHDHGHPQSDCSVPGLTIFTEMRIMKA